MPTTQPNRLAARAGTSPQTLLFGPQPEPGARDPLPIETFFEPTDQRIKNLLESLLQKVGFRALQKLGFHLQRNDYYSPLNDCDFLEENADLWTPIETPPEIDWRLDEQLAMAREISPFLPELRDVPVQPPMDSSTFAWKNNFWENADALVQYGLVRARKPARYVEIGCGWSSLLLKQALARNAAEGRPARVTLIEPYPSAAIFRHLPPEWQVHKTILQRAPFELFEQLEAGDFLFYDGSHCSKVGSDVNWFFFKILPRLRPGVIIHIHDISLPDEYPQPWIFERGQTWNEQYVLQAFLMHNSAYKILIANRYLFHQRAKELETLYHKLQPVYGSSFWMQKLGAALASPSATLSAGLVNEATAACQRGDQAAARAWLAAARKHNITGCDDALALGYVALNVGELRDALEHFTLAVRLKPAQPAAHSSRALALQLLGKSAGAKEAANAALRLNSKDTVALKVLARISINARDFAGAQSLCHKVLAIYPQDPDAKTMLQQCGPAQPAVQLNQSSTTVSVAVPASPRASFTNPAPSLGENLRKLEGLMGDYTARCEAWENLGAEHLAQQLVVGDFKKSVESYPPPAPARVGNDGFPVPPAALTMGYGAGDLDHYLRCGRKTYQMLTGLLQAHDVALESGDAILDWGGAAGRVVRQFTAEAQRGCEVWGCDVHAPSIQWAQNHLSPPFNFFNSSVLPHLPFPDGTFKFIYGMSVMTHLVAQRDLWLLELRRVLRPDGCLILTVHNERTWDWFVQHGMPAWMPRELCGKAELPGECLEIRGSRWEHVYTFFHSDYLRRVWGRFMNIREIVHCADLYQAAVVMKKIKL